MKKISSRAVAVTGLLVACIFVFLLAMSPQVEAKSRKSSYSKSSRSSSSHSSSSASRSWSRSSSSRSHRSAPSSAVWGKRNGGGLYGKKTPAKGTVSPASPKKTVSTSGYAKPGQKPEAAPERMPQDKTTPKSGYAKPTRKAGEKPAFSGGSSHDRKLVQKLKKKKTAASLAAYKAEKKKFAGPDIKPDKKTVKAYRANPIYKRVRRYGDFDYRNQYDRRNRYYSDMGWQMPHYGYRSSPRFGMWDAMVLWAMLDNPASYPMAYHHASDPGFRSWRQEADRLAMEDPLLRRKLDRLDREVAAMRGTPVDPGYLPPGMDPEIAIAPDALAQKGADRPRLVLATASATGNYAYFGELLKKHAPRIAIETRTTAGSIENLQLLLNGDVDAAIIQSDALGAMTEEIASRVGSTEQVELYPEVIQMIANKKSGIKSIKDIEPGGKHILYIGPEASGTAITWRAMVAQDDDYREIETRFASYNTALLKVSENPDAVMMFVSGLNSDFLRRAEAQAAQSKRIRLVEVDDWNFNNFRDHNGNRIYEFVHIPSATYPALQKSIVLGRDVETLAVSAVLVLRTDWAEKFGPEVMDGLSFAIMEALPKIRSHTNGIEE